MSEAFPLDGPRTLYGATKLAAELLVTEYRAAFGLRTVIDRCGVIAGPWQMGKVDQGVFTHWVLSHYFGRELSYIGYGGRGKQVRDLLHVADLVDLVEDQLLRPDHWDGVTANVGGGPEVSLSLLETTEHLRASSPGNERRGRAASAEDAPGRRPHLPLRLRAARGAHRLAAAARPAARCSRTSSTWVHDNERAVRAALG